MHLRPFSTLNYEQLATILTWRNAPSVRTWMLRDNEISWDEHLAFVATLKDRQDQRYFLVCEGDHALGVIDFTHITPTSAELGLYANPDNKGVGTKLMEAIITYAQKTLKVQRLRAIVFTDNEKAKHLYKKFDFIPISHHPHKERELIVMEREL